MSLIRDVDSTGEIAQSEQPKTFETEKNISAPIFPELETKAVEEVMGLETDTDRGRYSEKVNTLLEWAKSKTTDHSPQNLKWVIRSLELTLGTPPLAEKRINWMARYAYLDMEGKKINKEMDQFKQQ